MLLPALLLCVVIGISDGDTLKVRCATDQGQQSLTIRLAEIDAPEKGQPFGQRSKQHLSDLCFRKSAEIRATARDRYGRTLARVMCEGTDANAAMVRDGMAWAYTRYLTDPQIQAMEVLARRERAGLWTDEMPHPPWRWRQRRTRELPDHTSAP
jgi:endonuclease YncB( thermonuclease family)